MILYLSVIFVTIFILSLFNILFGLEVLQCQWWVVIVMCIIGVLFEFLIDAMCAIAIKVLPKNWFKCNRKIFSVGKCEQNFLNKIGVKKWKDYVWELGGLGGFSKRKIADPTSLEYVERYIMEINKGVVVHVISVFFSFSILLIFPLKFALLVGLEIAVVNAFLNILPICVLRHNWSKLMKLQKYLENKQRTFEAV